MGLPAYLTEHLMPRKQFYSEITSFPNRSRYYEVLLTIWTMPVAMLFISCLDYMVLWRLQNLPNKDRILDALQLLIFVVTFEICVLDFPVSDYSRFALSFIAATCLLFAVCYLHKRFRGSRLAESGSRTQADDAASAQLPQPNRRQFNAGLATYRAIVYITTTVCIFARDMPCWNNDFSKATSFGTGLMDIGLGCFVVCIGSIGPTANRPKADVKRCLEMKKALAQFLMLCACGLVKTISVVVIIAVKDVKFEESWREYGIHWNAFYALAVAKLAGTSLELFALPAKLPPLLAALAVGLGHEALLAGGGLAEYALAPGRTEPHNRAGLLGANREGLCSTPGLVALYLTGLALGRWSRAWLDGRRARLMVGLAAMLAVCLAYRALPMHLPGLLLPESRRLLNFSYCVWMAAISAFGLLNIYAVFAARFALVGSSDCPMPLHLKQVDTSGLLYFLTSNLLTGLANLLIDRAYPDRESTDGPLCFCLVLAYTIFAYLAARLAGRLINFKSVTGQLTDRCLSCC